MQRLTGAVAPFPSQVMPAPQGRTRLVIVNTHPIQYFAPFYAELARRWTGKFKVVYGSKRGIVSAPDEGFAASFQWDVDLLSGYDYEFIPEADSNAARPGEALRCRSISRCLSRLDPEIILVHGYSDPMARAALRWAWARKRPILLRGDTWSGPGERSGTCRRRAKRLLLRLLLAPRVTRFLAVGARNAAYWREVGGHDAKIRHVPYGIDSRRFYPAPDLHWRMEVRRRYGFSQNDRIIGYFGKLTEKKGILPLLSALRRVANSGNDAKIVLVGDGPLRPEIEALCTEYPIKIVLLGFRNQSEIADLYRIVDLAVVPSIFEETWGFAVQEALACGVPVAASDVVGCAPDLVVPGVNGWVLPVGAWPQWAEFLSSWLAEPDIHIAQSAGTLADKVPDFSVSADALACVLEEVMDELKLTSRP